MVVTLWIMAFLLCYGFQRDYFLVTKSKIHAMIKLVIQVF